ncbi:MAG: T9SS C-terminal target domain-containing protein, partial [Bacteroidetes bacterium]
GNDPYELFASLARVDNSGGFGEFLGGGVGRVHQLAQGITLAIDNRNTAGVQASGMQDPLQVQTGIEVSIPLKVLGNPRGDLNITAFINGAFHDQVSNQFLCPLPAGHPNPGEARNLDLETIPGPQFFGLCSGIEGGIIAFADGRLEQQLCEGDGSPDLLSFTSSSKSAASYAYILTDEAGRVQAISTSGQFDFEGSGFGIMQVWGVSYLGSLQLKTGDLLAQTPVSTDCYELSGNALRVIKDVAAGGHIFSSTGQNLLTTCRGDGRPDSIVFSAQGASGLAYTYLLTDTQNRFISVAAEGQEAGFDVEGNMADTLRLWGVSHAGALQLQAGVDITSSPLSGSCYELSENYLTILSDEVEGGSLELAEGGSQAIVCAGEAGAGMLEIRPHTTSIHPYRLVVTDASNQILALPPDREVDFSQLQAGRLRVWGVSYHGNFTASVGQPLHATAFSDDCFELSHNYIDVEQQAPQGGSVQFADGTFEQFWCVADRENKWVKLAHQQTEGPNYVYVETDQDGRVLHITGQDSLQIELQQPGVSLIRGLAFYGELLLQPGDTLPVADYADQCARLSANALTLTRDSVFGGTVSLDKGDTQWAGCVSDLASTPLLLRQQTPSRAPYVFLLSDTSGQVIQIVNGNSLAASGLLAGNYRLYGLSFSGQLLITPGAQLFAGPLASGCFDLSANFIELELQQHAGCTPTQLGQVVAPRQWRLYPNPTTELLNISGLQPGLHSHLSLYDAMGQQVLSRRIGQDHIQLSVGHLPAGIYTLRLSGSRGRDVTKLVIK